MSNIIGNKLYENEQKLNSKCKKLNKYFCYTWTRPRIKRKLTILLKDKVLRDTIHVHDCVT